jgi:tetratricopeptide (TPR) repeat protein
MRMRAHLKIFVLVTAIAVLLPAAVFSAEINASEFFIQGVQNSEKMEYSEAIDAFLHAIELDPKYSEAYYNLGHAYYKLHRYEEALDAYKKAVKIKPSYVDAQISIGIVASMLSMYDEAAAALKKAVKLKPNYAEAHYNLGNVYGEMENYEQAIKSYEKAVKLKPDFAEARFHLGLSYMEYRKQLLSAARNEQKALQKLNRDLASELNSAIK